MKKLHIVLNEHRTEGFLSEEKQVAYEVRKGADTNCFTSEGDQSILGVKFCELYSHHEDCTKFAIPALLADLDESDVEALFGTSLMVMVDDDKSDMALHGVDLDMVIRSWRKAMYMVKTLPIDTLFLDYYLDAESSITGMEILFNLLLEYKQDQKGTLPKHIVFISSDKAMSHKMQQAALEHGPYDVWVDHKFSMDPLPYQLLAVKLKKE